MRVLCITLGAFVLAACATPSPIDPGDVAWVEFAASDRAVVQIERRLYEQAGNPHFLIRVRVTNRGKRALGIDLRDAWRVFYPNQWGGLEGPERGHIDEEIVEPQALTPALKKRLKADYASKALDAIPAGGSIEYYREFNASGRADIDGTDSPYLFISIKGQLLLTNGTRVENLLPAADSLYLRLPVAWGTVPGGARVVRDA